MMGQLDIRIINTLTKSQLNLVVLEKQNHDLLIMSCVSCEVENCVWESKVNLEYDKEPRKSKVQTLPRGISAIH